MQHRTLNPLHIDLLQSSGTVIALKHTYGACVCCTHITGELSVVYPAVCSSPYIPWRNLLDPHITYVEKCCSAVLKWVFSSDSVEIVAEIVVPTTSYIDCVNICNPSNKYLTIFTPACSKLLLLTLGLAKCLTTMVLYTVRQGKIMAVTCCPDVLSASAISATLPRRPWKVCRSHRSDGSDLTIS